MQAFLLRWRNMHCTLAGVARRLCSATDAAALQREAAPTPGELAICVRSHNQLPFVPRSRRVKRTIGPKTGLYVRFFEKCIFRGRHFYRTSLFLLSLLPSWFRAPRFQREAGHTSPYWGEAVFKRPCPFGTSGAQTHCIGRRSHLGNVPGSAGRHSCYFI